MSLLLDDDDSRISPNIFMGIFSLLLSFLAYITSSTSLGKRSLSHTWLFSGLLVVNPSEESLKKVAPLTVTPPSTPSSNSNSSPNNKRNKNPTTILKDVSGLQLTCRSILPGALPLSVMTEKTRPAFRQWQALDAATCVWMASLLALASPSLLALYTVYQEHVICCDDLKCWRNWWRDSGGPGLVVISSSPPPYSMVVFIAGLSLWFWWRLVIHATQLPTGSIFRFSPFSYINGWMTFFATLFLLHLTTNEDTTIDSQTLLGIPLNAALDEWSTRVTLWVGLTGFYTPEVESSRARVFSNVFQLTHVLFAFCSSLLAFAVADPCRETMRLYWGNIMGDEVVIMGSSRDRLHRWFQRKQRQMAMLGVAILPILCWCTYLFQKEPFYHMDPRAVRTVLAWSFVWNMASIIRPLNQHYLLEAISVADRVLDTTKKPSSADVLFPFRNRSQRLLSTGSQLLVFPAMVLIVLTLGHAAGKPPMAVSSSNTNKAMTNGIFPFAFHHSLWTKEQEEEYRIWEEFQVKASVQNALKDASILAELSTVRANLDLCPANMSFSSVILSNNSSSSKSALKKNSGWNENEYADPVLRIATASQLTQSKALIKSTLVQVLRKLQKLAKQARLMASDLEVSEPNNSPNKKVATEAGSDFHKEQRQYHQDFYRIVQALAFHPLLTSTIILPVLDGFGLCLSTLWILYFIWYGIKAWYSRSHRRKYVLRMKGQTCRIMSLRK